MLHLGAPTDPGWASFALAHLDEILLDHAHCEKKAASTAVGLIFRYPHHGLLMTPLSQLAREELAHFELVLVHLTQRGIPFRRQRPSQYASRLMAIVREREPGHLIDTLLCAALIEARSCERMQLLAQALEQSGQADLVELGGFYRGLLAAEARHHQAYFELARQLGLMPEPELDARLATLADHEAKVVADTSQRAKMPRLHN